MHQILSTQLHPSHSTPVNTLVIPTDIYQWYQNLRHLDPSMGFKLGVFGFFPLIKIIMVNSSGAYVTFMYCSLKKPHVARRSWTHSHWVCFCVCGRQNPKTPQIKPHGWRHHCTGRYRRSGISGVYLWLYPWGYLGGVPLVAIFQVCWCHNVDLSNNVKMQEFLKIEMQPNGYPRFTT